MNRINCVALSKKNKPKLPYKPKIMNKSEFHSNRKEKLTKEYAELKKAKNKQKQSFEIIAATHGISPSTVRHIIFNKSYNQKTT